VINVGNGSNAYEGIVIANLSVDGQDLAGTENIGIALMSLFPSSREFPMSKF
jgi:hypothetical protein